MDQDKTKELKINFVTALSTAVLAFIGVIGLILALAQFVEAKAKILGIGGILLIVITFILGLYFTVRIVKGWVENG